MEESRERPRGEFRVVGEAVDVLIPIGLTGVDRSSCSIWEALEGSVPDRVRCRCGRCRAR